MTIRLGNSKVSHSLQKWRNFVYSAEQKRAFEEAWKREQRMRVGPLGKRIGNKATAFTKEIVAELKQQLINGEITPKELGTKQIRILDKFIVERLSIPQESKKLALQKMGYEAVLTDLLAEVVLGKPVKKQAVVSMIEEALFTANQLSFEYKNKLGKIVDLEVLRKTLQELKHYKDDQIRINPKLAINLKIVNTSAVREVLGEEMADLYASAYRKAKFALAEETLKQFG